VARTGLEVLSVALIAVYTLLVLLQVFFRYVLNEPLFWARRWSATGSSGA
jgi:TRAP-type C4-dicarboxylate transport system permease small subunit